MFTSYRDTQDSETNVSAGGRAAHAAALTHDQITQSAAPQNPRIHRLGHRIVQRIATLDIAPDLGDSIGSRRWFRGLGTFVGLAATALAFWPDFAPLEAAPSVHIDDAVRDEYRSQMILPLALGADSGRHMGATELVARSPPRPNGPDRDARDARSRATVSTACCSAPVSALAIRAASPNWSAGPFRFGTSSRERSSISSSAGAAPGRSAPARSARLPRALRSRTELGRTDAAAGLALTRNPIRVDDTPLRIRGTVGASLYRSARAAGAPGQRGSGLI